LSPLYLIKRKSIQDNKVLKHLPLLSKLGTNRNKSVLKSCFLVTHRYLGLLAGLIFFAVCLSGLLLIFEKELTPIIYRQEQVVRIKDSRLTMDALVQVAKTAQPNKKIFRIEVHTDPARSIRVQYGAKKTGYAYAFINPYDGKILSTGDLDDRFFQITLNFHRFLLAGSIGKTITGLSCVIVLFLSISGIYLWWPTGKKSISHRLKIKTGKNKKRFIWDLHSVGGFYSSFFLIIICLTGLTWSYDGVSKSFYAFLDGKSPLKEKTTVPKAKTSQEIGIYEYMQQQMQEIYPNSGNIIYTFPQKGQSTLTATKENTESLVQTNDLATFDYKTGELKSKQSFSTQSLGSKTKKMMKPIHTGSFLGLGSKIVFFIVLLFASSLPLTGFLIWINKKGKKKRPNAQKARLQTS